MSFPFSAIAHIGLFSSLVSLVACQQQLAFNAPEGAKKLMVTAFVGPDSLATLYFTENHAFEGWVEQTREIVFPQDLAPTIYADGKAYPLKAKPDPFGRYYYRSSKLLPDSGIYRLELMYGGDSLSANAKVPHEPHVDNLTYEYVSVKMPYTNQIRDQIRIYFTDTPASSDAYQLLYGAEVKREVSRYDSTTQLSYLDTVLYQNDRLSAITSDRGMDGKRLSFDINRYQDVIPQLEVQADGSTRPYQLIWLVLIGHTPDSYQYFSTMQQYFLGFGDDPFQEPVIIPTNIQNGFGIFAAYHPSDTAWMKIYLD